MKFDVESVIVAVIVIFVSGLIGFGLGSVVYGDDKAEAIREQAESDKRLHEMQEEEARNATQLIINLDTEMKLVEFRAKRMCKQWEQDAISYFNVKNAVENQLVECIEMVCAVGDPKDCEESFGFYQAENVSQGDM
jgi:hypothetical protein